ncbi:hypothetical protein [Corynebacterium belfantii]|uniref:Antitoxin HicB n=1 Tax=Corynebacterium belfantii TaxID=2014537 RepID=A0ABS0L9R6_9CORY|nr:hypothetical protein [Corynebacterium belfantii]MBG9287907.1 hypothetical protein [Corynebacterium belfantii]MBG9326518.1 hypothetical protein [Corynebacterium belfantii]MBG9332603.1 hypothetical protein [Corynebacterium belfantii]MBG9346234.1 hypothetical protein [Corynebacterium belfantii]MBG9350099.1 hypothetical protein [Corynebacterium belfantii]
MTRYTAHVTPDGKGWMVTVPEIDRVTYAPHARDVEDMSLDLIAIMVGESISPEELEIQWPEDIQSTITAFHEAKRSADLAQQQARRTMSTKVRELQSSGHSYRDIAALLGISYQRAAQLATP